MSFRLHRPFFEEELTPRGLLIHLQASLLVLALVLETTAKDDLSGQSGNIMVHDLLDVYTCLSVAIGSQKSTSAAVAGLNIAVCDIMSLSSSLVTLKLTGVCDQLEPASKAYTGSHQKDSARWCSQKPIIWRPYCSQCLSMSVNGVSCLKSAELFCYLKLPVLSRWG